MNAPVSDFPDVFRENGEYLPCVFLIDVTDGPICDIWNPGILRFAEDFSRIAVLQDMSMRRLLRGKGVPKPIWACPRGLRGKRLPVPEQRSAGHNPRLSAGKPGSGRNCPGF